MYELIRLSENDYYVESPTNIGVVKVAADEVVLIDGGSDKSAAKKALARLSENGWRLRAVLCTHSHADHIGGCRLLRERTGCPVYAYGMEHALAGNPVLEPAMLYGGDPIPELKSKFFLAEKFECEPLSDSVLPEGMSIVPLKGHSPDLVGFMTADGSLFIGDALISEDALAKYPFTYLWSVRDYIASVKALKDIKANRFIAAHAAPVSDIVPLANKNLLSLEQNAKILFDLCKTPRSFENILKEVFVSCNIIRNAGQYYLTASVIRSYLAYFVSEGMMEYYFDDGVLLWKNKEEI